MDTTNEHSQKMDHNLQSQLTYMTYCTPLFHEAFFSGSIELLATKFAFWVIVRCV